VSLIMPYVNRKSVILGVTALALAWACASLSNHRQGGETLGHGVAAAAETIPPAPGKETKSPSGSFDETVYDVRNFKFTPQSSDAYKTTTLIIAKDTVFLPAPESASVSPPAVEDRKGALLKKAAAKRPSYEGRVRSGLPKWRQELGW
jgi:hypothetical protein